MINVAIVEDEDRAIDNLKYALSRYENEAGITFHTSIFKDAELFLTNYKSVYDIVFMDIMLPGMTGMDAARRMRKFDESVSLIFLTSMAQFAINGYEVNAVDYILKPFRYPDLKLRLDRVCRNIAKGIPKVRIPIPGGVKTVSVDDVYYIESRGHQLTYHLIDGDITARGEPIKELEQSLSPFGFARCGASYLVNLRHCTGMQGNEVHIGQTVLYMTRGKKKEFCARFAEYVTNSGGK